MVKEMAAVTADVVVVAAEGWRAMCLVGAQRASGSVEALNGLGGGAQMGSVAARNGLGGSAR